MPSSLVGDSSIVNLSSSVHLEEFLEEFILSKKGGSSVPLADEIWSTKGSDVLVGGVGLLLMLRWLRRLRPGEQLDGQASISFAL